MNWRRLQWYVAAPLLATIPVISAASDYGAQVPLAPPQLVRDCAIVMAPIVVIAAALMALRGDDRTNGAALALCVLLCGAYPYLADKAHVLPSSLRDTALATSFVVVVVTAFWALARWHRELLAASHRLLGAIVVVSLAYTGYVAVNLFAGSHRDSLLAQPGGKPIALPPGPRPPDIIHIVFDGLGRLDVLQDVYGLDSKRIHDALATQGMTVNDGAVANYSQTFPALASLLSMEYLDNAATIAVGGVEDRAMAQGIIRRSAVIRGLKARGYAFTLLSSGFEGLTEHPDADDGIFGTTLFNDFEFFLLRRTMLRALPLARLSYEPQRLRTQSLLDALESFRPGDRPRLVIAHLLLPHPPFRYTAGGRFAPPRRAYTIRDAKGFPGTASEYRRGYAAQAQYVFGELETLLTRWRRLPHPPIAIVHGDHGPGLGYDQTNPERSNFQGRMRIFLAVQSPIPIGAIGSPVNIYRQVFRSAFGVPLSPLPDRSYVSTWDRPLDFIEVDLR